MCSKLIFSSLFLGCSLLFAGSSSDSTKSFIKLNDDKVVYGNVKIKKELFSEPKIILNDTTEYDVSDVKCLQSEDGYYRVFKAKGSFSKDKLVKRTTEGKIDLYSDYVTSYVHNAAGPSYSTTSYQEVYFSKNDGKVIGINYDNLLNNLSDNEESMSHLKAHKTLKYVRLGLGLVGLGIVGVGLSKIDKEEGLTSSAKSTIIVGAVVTNLAWIPSFMQSDRIDKAIKAYNK